MKINEEPKVLYLQPDSSHPAGKRYLNLNKVSDNDIEYTRTDAFVEKACEFLKSYRQDTPDGMGYIAGIVNDKTIENFINYMNGE